MRARWISRALAYNGRRESEPGDRSCGLQRAAGSMNHILSRETLSARPGQRVPSLDGLRAISVMLVLGSHFVSGRLIPGGLGVTVFFVISGFLISRLMYSELASAGEIQIPRFYLRRLVRLAPVQFAFVGAVVSLFLLLGLRFDPREPLSAVTYVANYLYAPALSAGHAARASATMPLVALWSLSVEEHFYLVLPLVMAAFGKRPKRVLVVMAFVATGVLADRCVVAVLRPDLIPTKFFDFRTECRLDSLAIGVGLSCLCQTEAGRAALARYASPSLGAVAALGLVATLASPSPAFKVAFGYTIESACVAILMAVLLLRGGRLASLLNTRPFVTVGRLSYSLYVWSALADWIGHGIAQPLLRIPLEFAISFGIATLSYLTLERWFLALRSRLRESGELASPS